MHTPSPIFAYHEKPTLLDFPGKWAALLFTSGCNFRCGYCHNFDHLARRKAGVTWGHLEQTCARFKKDWVDGVVISGGEPTLEPDLPRLIKYLREKGFSIKLDTNGSRPEMLAQVLPDVTYVAMDIKCSLERYPEYVAFADTAAIARSVELLKPLGKACEFRTTVVEGVHSDEEMRAIGKWLDGATRYVLQPFLPRHNMPDTSLKDTPRTSVTTLERLAALVRETSPGLSVELRGG